jgi:uncharacterized protein YhbP (UPF0306 family)
MTLATASPDGEPHAAPVYFVAEPLGGEAAAPRFYFFSDPRSLHGQHLAHSPRLAAALYPPCFDWQDIRGVQMRGFATPVSAGEEWNSAWGLYQTKFPFVAGLKAIVSRNRLYAFAPSWIRLVDNRRGFGFKQEWRFP